MKFGEEFIKKSDFTNENIIYLIERNEPFSSSTMIGKGFGDLNNIKKVFRLNNSVHIVHHNNDIFALKTELNAFFV